VEDYEYLAMVARLGDPAFAAAQAQAVAPTAYSVGDDPARMEAARIALARRIEELTGGAPAPSAPPAATPPATPDQPVASPDSPATPTDTPTTPTTGTPSEGTPADGTTGGATTGTGQVTGAVTIKTPDRPMVNPAAGQIALPASVGTANGSGSGSSDGHGSTGSPGASTDGQGSTAGGSASGSTGGSSNATTGSSTGGGSVDDPAQDASSGGGCTQAPGRRSEDLAAGLIIGLLLVTIPVLRRRHRRDPFSG
jgi:hypothetical protein